MSRKGRVSTPLVPGMVAGSLNEADQKEERNERNSCGL